MRAILLLLICAAALPGCALLGKNEPIVPRYFTPEYAGDASSAPVRSDLQLRLGRVEGWSHVRERMVARNSGREVFYSEDRQWTERPEVYLVANDPTVSRSQDLPIPGSPASMTTPA